MFLIKWWKKITNNQNKGISKRKAELVYELNEYSLLILTQKKQLEEFILEKISMQLALNKENSFLQELKKDFISLQKLDFAKKLDESQLKSEINYLENVLINRFDELEEKDLKLCAYFRLGFNTKEIATIEGIDLNEVRFYKTAIRRKLNINSKTNLRDYLIFEE